jgi:chromate transporter
VTRGSVGEVARLFLKLGFIGFGGPAAHIALMREETVRRRRWLDDQEFLDMLGAASIIPGPSSTELGIYLGLRRAGFWGLAAAGACFIGPAMLIVLGLAWLYVRYGQAPGGQEALYGIKPVVVAIILQALWALGRTAVKGPLFGVLGLAAAAAYLGGANPVAVLAACGALLMLGERLWRARSSAGRVETGESAPPARSDTAGDAAHASGDQPRASRPDGSAGSAGEGRPQGQLLFVPGPAVLAGAAAGAGKASLGALFLAFLKIGSIVFGSGYVLLVFLRGELVTGPGWLTDQQLLDAVAVGQFTPGPVFTTATFIGYVVAGLPGALVSTAGVFLPAFVLIPVIDRVLEQVKTSPWVRGALDGINIAALGLMAGVSLQLGRAAIMDALTLAIGLAATAAAFWGRINPAWLILGGAAIGLAELALP